MSELTDEEKVLFCKAALVIAKKGHLTKEAILNFIFSHDKKKGKKTIDKFYRLQLLKKHRTDTFELTTFGKYYANQQCNRFREKYSKYNI